MKQHSMLPIRFGWKFASACLLALLVISLSIPTVRASLSAWLGLSVAPSNQVPATSVVLATPADTASSEETAPAQETNEKPAEINQLSAQIGWNVLAPNHSPEGYQFQSAYYDTNQRMVILTYMVTRPLPGANDPSLTASKTITLLEAQKNDFVPMQVAPDANLTDVMVNGQPAVFTVGAWDTEFVKDDNDPNGGKMVSTWRNDLLIKNLYWQKGDVYLVIVTDDEAVDQQEMIDMAASMSGS
ncbi:MAG: hypothetical protein ABFD44_11635 [Anaerolineaceae bacterium]